MQEALRCEEPAFHVGSPVGHSLRSIRRVGMPNFLFFVTSFESTAKALPSLRRPNRIRLAASCPARRERRAIASAAGFVDRNGRAGFLRLNKTLRKWPTGPASIRASGRATRVPAHQTQTTTRRESKSTHCHERTIVILHVAWSGICGRRNMIHHLLNIEPACRTVRASRDRLLRVATATLGLMPKSQAVFVAVVSSEGIKTKRRVRRIAATNIPTSGNDDSEEHGTNKE